VVAVAERIPKIKAQANVPVGVGFGIRDAESARAVARVADAVVVGSRIIQEMESVPREQAVAAAATLLAELRRAVDEVAPAARST
jgi:tryptophan synthase alpha chain